MAFRIKRIYDSPEQSDGYRVLVDRLWPRGVSKADAELDQWCKEVAPTADLRQWWDHDPDRFEEFGERYRVELDDNDAVEDLLNLEDEHETLTLLYAARDPEVNHALVLRDYLADSAAR